MVFLVILSILTGFWEIFGRRPRKPVTNCGGVLLSAVQAITSADNKTINPDRAGGGWFDKTEVRTIYADKHSTIVVTDLNAGGAEFHQSTTVSIDGLTRSVATDLDGNGVADRINSHVLVINSDSSSMKTTTKAVRKCVHISQSPTYSKWYGLFEVCRIGSNSNDNQKKKFLANGKLIEECVTSECLDTQTLTMEMMA